MLNIRTALLVTGKPTDFTANNSDFVFAGQRPSRKIRLFRLITCHMLGAWLSSIAFCFVPDQASAQHLDSAFGDASVVTPGLAFLPRRVREKMIFEPAYDLADPAYRPWRVALNDRDFEREGASQLALIPANLFEYRVGDLVNVRTRNYNNVNGEVAELRANAQFNDLFPDDLGYGARARLRYEFPGPHEGGIVFYYQHRERFEGRAQERTKWAQAQNTPGGSDLIFIDEHELRLSPERQVMDEVGLNLDWWITPKTRFNVSTVYREGDDELVEQRTEFDTRSGTLELPGQPPRRGYRYDATTHQIENGIVTSATSIPGAGRLERQLHTETEEKRRYGFVTSLSHSFNERSWLRIDGEFANWRKLEPDRQDTEYGLRDDISFSYSLTGSGRPIFELAPFNLNDLGLRKVEFENNLEERQFQHYRATFHHELKRGHEIEAGSFFIQRTDVRNVRYQRFEPNPSPRPGGFVNEIQGPGSSSVDGINLGPNMDPSSASRIDISSLQFLATESAYKSAREDYDAERNISGGWLAYHWEPNRKTRIRGGVRLEHSREDHRAFEALWTGTESVVSPIPILNRNRLVITPTRARRNDTFLLPSVLLEYQPDTEVYYSFQVHQSLQRPHLWESVPSFAATQDDGVAPRVFAGNPDLAPSRQTQITFTRNHAFDSGAFLSTSLSYWDLRDPISSASWFQPFKIEHPDIVDTSLRNFRFEQAQAGNNGQLFQANIHYAQQLSFLPHPFDQFGVFGNYSYTQSSHDIEVGGNQRNVDLTFQPEHRGLLGLFYRSPSWRINLFANMHSDYLISVGQTRNSPSGAGDIFAENRITLDSFIEYRINESAELYLGAYNLLDTQLRLYEGTPQRQTRTEFYGRSFQLGMNYFF